MWSSKPEPSLKIMNPKQIQLLMVNGVYQMLFYRKDILLILFCTNINRSIGPIQIVGYPYPIVILSLDIINMMAYQFILLKLSFINGIGKMIRWFLWNMLVYIENGN